MFLTAHTSAAILIASKTSNPILGFILGLLSHFVLDFIPHGEGGLFNDKNKTKEQALFSIAKIAAIDLVVALIFLFSFLHFYQPDNIWVFIWTSFGSWLPDFTWGAIEVFKLKSIYWFLSIHHKAHDLLDIVYPIKYGLFVQFSFIVLMLYLTIYF